MFSKELEDLIEITLADGVLTDQEKAVLVKHAEKEGVDVDELDIYIQSLLQKRDQEAVAHNATRGTVMKCPRCGVTVSQGTAVCPSCGMVFNVSETSKAYDEFFKKVSETTIPVNSFSMYTHSYKKPVQEVSQYIQTFPVPNNRLDLLEFLTNLKPYCNSLSIPSANKHYSKIGTPNFYSLHYWKLYKNCAEKAMKNFSNDPDFQEYFDFYESECIREKKISFEKVWRLCVWWGPRIIQWGLVILFLFWACR